MARRARVLAHGRPAACQVQQGVGRNVQRQRGFSRQVLSARSVETGVIVVAQRDCHFFHRKIRVKQMIKASFRDFCTTDRAFPPSSFAFAKDCSKSQESEALLICFVMRGQKWMFLRFLF